MFVLLLFLSSKAHPFQMFLKLIQIHLTAHLHRYPRKRLQDHLYRNQLDLQMYELMKGIDNGVPPITEGQKELAKELSDQWQKAEMQLNGILSNDIGEFNQLLRDKGVEYIAPSEKEEKKDKKKSS